MVTSVVAVAPPGASWPDLTIDFTGLPGQVLAGLGITGIEPVAAAVQTRSYGVNDGEFHTGSKVGKRNIVLTVGLVTSDARDLFYAYFLPKNAIKLRLNFDDREFVEIDGYVETTTPGGRFTEMPELPTMQVSIICPKPNFLSELKTIEGVAGQVPAEVDLPYSGTTNGGFFLNLHAGGSENLIGSVNVVVSLGGSERRMQFENLYVPVGWRLHISTHHGGKKAERHPPISMEDELDPSSVLGKMVDTYFWPQLFAGVQKVRVETVHSNLPRMWTLVYADQFAGV
jgi:hypothetical protein